MTNETQTIKQSKTFKGVVVSDKMDKTVVVAVNRLVKHPKYGKFINRTKRFKAHDADNKFKVGDEVTIQEVKPISKDKTFIVLG